MDASACVRVFGLIMNIARRIISTSAAAILIVGLSGCSAVDEFVGHQKELHYDTWDDAPKRGDLAFVPASFIPKDATDLRIRTITNGPGTSVRYESDTPPTGEECEPGKLEGDDLTNAGWWPETLPADGIICSHWSTFVLDGIYYGYSS